MPEGEIDRISSESHVYWITGTAFFDLEIIIENSNFGMPNVKRSREKNCF